MKKILISMAAIALVITTAGNSLAELGGQVFYKFGTATLDDDRSGGAYTDALGAGPKNDGDSGNTIAAGLDVPLMKLFGNTLLGEIMVESTVSRHLSLMRRSGIVRVKSVQNRSYYTLDMDDPWGKLKERLFDAFFHSLKDEEPFKTDRKKIADMKESCPPAIFASKTGKGFKKALMDIYLVLSPV